MIHNNKVLLYLLALCCKNARRFGLLLYSTHSWQLLFTKIYVGWVAPTLLWTEIAKTLQERRYFASSVFILGWFQQSSTDIWSCGCINCYSSSKKSCTGIYCLNMCLAFTFYTISFRFCSDGLCSKILGLYLKLDLKITLKQILISTLLSQMLTWMHWTIYLKKKSTLGIPT